MRNMKNHYFSTLTRALLFVACLLFPPLIVNAAQPAAPVVGQISADQTAVVAANNDFAFRLYHQLALANVKENIFFSPLSIELALAMTYNGARGDTQTAMAKTCGWQQMSLDSLNNGCSTLLTSLQQKDDKVTIALGNSLWMKEGAVFDPTFSQRCTSSYHAELQSVNFVDPGTPTRINQWVDEQTHGHIKQIVTPKNFNHFTRLALVNTVYFKGIWTDIFQKADTTEQPFSLKTTLAAKDDNKTIPLMKQTGNYPYYEGDGMQAVVLPYGGGQAAMIVLLPYTKTDFATFCTGLTAEKWNLWMKKLHYEKGYLSLPRFSLTSSLDLNTTLSSMGMQQAFSKVADFSGISTTEQLFIDKILHKSTLDVDEEGTKASAVTIVINNTLSIEALGNYYFTMKIDHPFILAIVDASGAIIFLGSVTNPA